jgi:hypothetical protein
MGESIAAATRIVTPGPDAPQGWSSVKNKADGFTGAQAGGLKLPFCHLEQGAEAALLSLHSRLCLQAWDALLPSGKKAAPLR